MTDKNYTVIAIVADRSGSMTGFADGSVTKATRSTNGIHDLVRKQRTLGKTEFVMTAFDSGQWEKHALGNGDTILEWTCEPRGWTPLLDAVGTTIAELGDTLKAMPEDERPGRVIFVIATDGLENVSKEYKRDQVAAMIERQRDQYQWDFVYIGAGFDDFLAEASSINIDPSAFLSSTPVAMAAAYSSTNDAIMRNRVAGTAFSYNADERQAVADAENGKTTGGQQ